MVDYNSVVIHHTTYTEATNGGHQNCIGKLLDANISLLTIYGHSWTIPLTHSS